MQTYTGSCHCGAVRYEVTMEPPAKGLTGNCSMCQRAGYILTFVPAASFKLLAGEDALTDYQFNKRYIHHVFCKHCGIKSFSRGKSDKGEMVAVNLRCLAELDTTKLEVSSYNCIDL